MSIFSVLFYEPIYNALIVVYRFSGENLGLAIIFIALISRFIMIPLTLKQIQMAESSQEFSAKMKEIKRKYKNDKETQQKELLKLQSEHLPAQLSGCLPLIFQSIFFIYIYNVIRNIINEGAVGFNKVAYSFVDKFPENYDIHTSFFGIVDLKDSASKIGFGTTDVIPYIALILLVGISQYGSMRILTAMRGNDKKVEKNNKKDDEPASDFAEVLQQSTRQTMLLMPILIMFISYNLPAGLSLYWISQSSFVIIQQFAIGRLGLAKKSKVSGNEETQNLASVHRGNSQENLDKKAKKKKKGKHKKRR